MLPGQDKPTPSGPTSEAAWFVVSCGVRLSEVGLSEIRKPQVRFLSSQSNSLNFKTQKGYQRRLDRLPFTARIERAQFHRARSASKKGNWPLPSPSFGGRALRKHNVTAIVLMSRAGLASNRDGGGDA